MGVYIKGMKMPKCCDVCKFSGWSNLHQTALCRLYDYKPCFDDFSQEYENKRSNNCPLVEVPTPHGRLIDEDEITAYSYLERNDEEVESLDEFPTVIEAEGSNDNRKAKGD